MFYDKFIALCNRKGVSPSKAATDNGFNKATVSIWKKKYLNGQDVRPSFDTLSALSKYFDVSSDYFLKNDEQSSEEVVEMNNMAYYRNKKNLSQQNVADCLGISRQAYCNYEIGKREASYETLLKLAECLETSVDELLRESPTSRDVSDEDIMFALFDGDKDITPEMFDEVKQFARFVREKHKNK